MGYLRRVQVTGYPRVRPGQPMAVPRPTEQVWIMPGMGTGMPKNTQGLLLKKIELSQNVRQALSRDHLLTI
jgi:hypothetical protein